MIITNKATGPRYATDATAHSLRSFVENANGARPATASRHERAATATPKSLDELYPALFAVEMPSRSSLGARLIGNLKAAVVAIRRAPVAGNR